MSHLFNIEPLWNIEEYKSLNYKLDNHKDQGLIKKYVKAGHRETSMTLYNYFEPNPMPDSIEYIKSYFDLDCTSVAINMFMPGQYLPIHCDLYQAYKKHHDLTESQVINRYIVMLEDGIDGQMLTIGNVVYTMWKAGDTFVWKDCDKHTFYNMSIKSRYAAQITGIKND